MKLSELFPRYLLALFSIIKPLHPRNKSRQSEVNSSARCMCIARTPITHFHAINPLTWWFGCGPIRNAVHSLTMSTVRWKVLLLCVDIAVRWQKDIVVVGICRVWYTGFAFSQYQVFCVIRIFNKLQKKQSEKLNLTSQITTMYVCSSMHLCLNQASK